MERVDIGKRRDGHGLVTQREAIDMEGVDRGRRRVKFEGGSLSRDRYREGVDGEKRKTSWCI